MLRTFLIVLIPIVLFLRCSDPFSDALVMDPGTLGVSATADLECSELDVMRVLDQLIDSSEFTIPIQDSSAVKWWSEGGFDFLTYRCVKIKNHYYMISLNSDEMNETSIAIRSVYERKSKNWKPAKKFNRADKYNAGKAMKILLYNLPSCK